MPMDAVVADFEAGAAEVLSPTPPPITGTSSRAGSLFHPSYAGVSLACFTAASPT